jgi:dephospho-CoA kinase
MSFCVGLTGGIGCGKSAATAIFAELGAAIVDTDVISRELTGPAGAAMEAISAAFGPAYILPDGSLDRPRMRALVFSDPTQKRALEAILHPLIRSVSREQIATARAPYVMLVVPLLVETGAYRDLLDRVLVIDCDERLQMSRTMARSGLSEEEVMRIMASQAKRGDRLKSADDVIVNDDGIDRLRVDVETLHQRYLHLARNPA